MKQQEDVKPIHAKGFMASENEPFDCRGPEGSGIRRRVKRMVRRQLRRAMKADTVEEEEALLEELAAKASAQAGELLAGTAAPNECVVKWTGGVASCRL